ncbi:MAG: nicotinamide riboside transporter PnuC [Prevotellaceae bacterium]|jgi:nicotinamide mononucleotide transporter|nr:nicotinamide riboside transporter PnuC [Prevotellaceae bacterium]
MGENILFTLGDFPVSAALFLETVSSILSFLCILFAVREKILTFPLGMISTALYFFVFYMQQVYSSMTLQVMFFAFNAYGLYRWKHPGKKDAAKPDNTLAVTVLTPRNRIVAAAVIAILTLTLGYVMSSLHGWLPSLFPEEAKYVYLDTAILSASLVAQYLMALKKLENWAIWLLVDVVAAPFYFITVGWATGILYFIFIITAVTGWVEWKRNMKAIYTDKSLKS